MLAAEAPPNSKAEIKDGKTLWVANSGGKELADSLRVLDFQMPVSNKQLRRKEGVYLNKLLFSESLAKAKLSSPEQTFTSRLFDKKPDSTMPVSRKPLASKRDLGLGFSSFLKIGNTPVGMEPLEFAAGGG